ncbi:hypothetical protein PTKIN_Ptkin05aG0188300 [Pterospermum kingtungense]
MDNPDDFYDLGIWLGEEGVGGQIPDEYEVETRDPYCQIGFRRCHGLIERQNRDTLNLVTMLMQKLFHRSSSYNPRDRTFPNGSKRTVAVTSLAISSPC